MRRTFRWIWILAHNDEREIQMRSKGKSDAQHKIASRRDRPTSSTMNMLRSLWLFIAACHLLSTSAEEDTITLHGRLQFPDKRPYNTTTKISVNHGAYTTYSRRDGNFTLYDLPPGIYQIDVLSVHHHFSQVKCQYKPDLQLEQKPTLSCLEYIYPGSAKRVLDEILVIHALAEVNYFEERKGFSLFSVLKNPMLLMMIVMVGMMYMMPKLMEDMNPEERAQMKKQMAMQQDPTKMLGELFSGGSTEEKPKKSKKQK